MLTLSEAISQRRSVRKFKPDNIPDEIIDQMLEAARLAPSASNRQPWRFQVIRDPALKQTLFDEATFGSKHILEAPVIIACGSELLTFVKGHKLAPPGSEYFGAESEDWEELKKFIPDGHMNTFIAVEHMVFRVVGSVRRDAGFSFPGQTSSRRLAGSDDLEVHRERSRRSGIHLAGIHLD